MINAGFKTENQIQTQVEIERFVRQVNDLHKQYNECNKKFADDPMTFFKSVIDCNGNLSDLAKLLNFPELLVAHIVTVIADDMTDDDEFHYREEFGSKFCEQFAQHVKGLNVASDASSKFTIEVGLDDLDNLYWNDDMWVSVPCDFEVPQHLIDRGNCFQVQREGWGLYLRMENYGNKHYLEPSSPNEQAEVVEMLRLMSKYLL
jgi:hypothetical protein